MEIRILDPPQGNVVAREVIDGEEHGEFYLSSLGHVRYRYAPALRDVFVNPDLPRFLAAVTAWRRYLIDIRRASDPVAGADQIVAALRRGLEQNGGDFDHDDSFWLLIVEQVNQGML